MKKTILTTVILVVSFMVIAQSVPPTTYPKTIEVEGAAELEIVPDEIYVQVELKEYVKKAAGKQTIDQLKTNFLSACNKAGIPDSAISVSNYEGSDGNYYLRRRNRRDEELLNSMTYQIKFSSTAKIDQLVALLDENATESFNIVKTSHSNIINLRKGLKIQSIQAAKDKANYLAEAIGERVGEAINITEPDDSRIIGYASNTFSQARTSVNSNEGGVDFKKLRLRFTTRVTFALK